MMSYSLGFRFVVLRQLILSQSVVKFFEATSPSLPITRHLVFSFTGNFLKLLLAQETRVMDLLFGVYC